MYNCKNYTDPGGDVTHFGGKVIFEEGATVEGLPSADTPAAENQAASTATTVAGLKDDFNALLAKLKAAGLMAADAPAADPEPDTNPEQQNPEQQGGS